MLQTLSQSHQISIGRTSPIHLFSFSFSAYRSPVSINSQKLDIASSPTKSIMGDKLVLRGLKFHGYHGVHQEERKLGQKFLIDVDAWMDLQPAGHSDCLEDTLSYTAIYRMVKEIVEGEPRNLLESVAQMIASKVLSNFSQVSAVRVQIGKPHVAVIGPIDYLGVEITRYRKTERENASETAHS